jgi:hypothetical protein
MSTSAQETARGAQAAIERAGGFTAFIRDYGLGGILNAIFLTVIAGVSDFGNIIFGAPAALGRGVIQLINIVFDGLGQVVGAGSQTAAESFASGVASLLGPIAQPAAIGTVMLSFAVFIYSLNRLNISPLSIIQSVRG